MIHRNIIHASVVRTRKYHAHKFKLNNSTIYRHAASSYTRNFRIGSWKLQLVNSMLSLFIPPPLPAFCDSVSVTDINDARSRFIGSLFTDFRINDARSHFIGSLFTDFHINDAWSRFI